MELIKIGVIATTHGIKGELKINSKSDCFNKDFKATMYLGEAKIPVHIKTVRQQGDKLLVQFKEYNDINQVLNYRGYEIFVDKEDLPELDENEYYIEDLIGMDCVDKATDEYLGTVKDVVKYPQCYYLEVYNGDKKSLVPFIEEFVADVTDVIIINNMEGLFC